MASIHSGTLKFTPFLECQNDPEAIRFWGVDKPATVEVPGFGDVRRPVFIADVAGKRVEVYRHPELFISEEVRAWYAEYKWVSNGGGGAVRYAETNPLFHLATGVYEYYIRKRN